MEIRKSAQNNPREIPELSEIPETTQTEVILAADNVRMRTNLEIVLFDVISSSTFQNESDDPLTNLQSEEIIPHENESTEKSEKTSLITEEEIKTKAVEVFHTKYYNENRFQKSLDERLMTDRMRRRCDYMDTAINAHKFLNDPTRLYMAITRKESNDGQRDRMCKKTFYRLLSYLCVKKRIRLWRVTFTFNEKMRALTFITAKEIDASYSPMKSHIKQARTRFFLSIHSEMVRRKNASAKKAMDKSKTISPAINTSARITSASKTNYGLTPKFVRLRTLHEFLFYVVYDNCCESEAGSGSSIDRETAIEHWKVNEPHQADFNEADDLPTIYSTKVDWKMFVPVLPRHNDYCHGWFLVSDALYRMPLSVFIRVVNFTYEIRGLDEILSHPIRKHFPLHRLPVEIQQALFHQRKYLFNIEELLRQFCCIGLAQTGTKKFNTIDNRFYFLNRRATLLNTISSKPGYTRTSVQDYPEKLYQLQSLHDVQTYWDDMYKICMSTKLNRKSANDGSAEKYKEARERLVGEACKVMQSSEAADNDDGFLPGDRRGAAGLDTTFFAHLERNWSFTTNIFKAANKMRCSYGTAVRYKKAVRMGRENPARRDGRAMSYTLATASIRRRQSVSRRRALRSTEPIRRKKNVYDEVDKAAIASMSSSRVEWSASEDNFLLLCRLAQLYLSSNGRPIPSTVIRDLVHWHCKSLDKTSRACARRILYIMKKLGNSRQINHNVFNCLGEIKENDLIHRRFGDLSAKLKKTYANENDFMEAFKIHYIDLVYLLTSQYYNMKNSIDAACISIPDTLSDFSAKYKIKSEIYDMNTLRFDAPQSRNDIEIMTIVNLIHSTMCCNFDKTSWSIQLYEIYKDFTERQLSIAMQKVRSEQLISVNKVLNRYNEQAKNRSLPLSASSYHLSITYQQQMFTRIAYELFDGSFGRLRAIVDSIVGRRQTYDFNVWNSTSCFLLAELSQKPLFEIDIEVPKNILIFDKSQHMVNESYERMFARVNECDYVDLDESGAQPANAAESASSDDITTTLQAKLAALPPESYHLMCIVSAYGKTFPAGECKIDESGHCSLDCLKRGEYSPVENAVKSLIDKRDVYGRISADEQRRLALLPDEFTIAETNLLLVFDHLLTKSAAVDVKQRNHSDLFKQMLEVIEDTLANNEKRNVSSLLGQDLDFDEYYDTQTNKSRSRDMDITDKQHILHDFLYVKTCKLSLIPAEQPADCEQDDEVNIDGMIDTREKIMEKIVEYVLLFPPQKRN